MQDAVRVERVDEPFLHDRAAARAAIVAVAIDVARRVREPPLPLAVLRVEAVDAVLVRDAVEEDQTVFRDDDAAIPRADPLLPELGRAARGPLLQPARLARDLVSLGSKPLGPVVGLRARERARERDEREG